MSQMFHPELPELQIAWDNTSIASFKTCPRRYYYEIVCGYRGKGRSPALEFGSAIHACYEHFDRGVAKGEPREAVLLETVKLAYRLSESWVGESEALSLDSARTRVTLLRSIIWYERQFQNDPLKTLIFDDGTSALELSFRFELPFFPTCLRDDGGSATSYLYCGHIDKLASFQGVNYVIERKHTKSTLSDSYFLRYTYGAQVSGYIYAGKVCLPVPIGGAIVDATQVGVTFSRFSRRQALRVNESLDDWMADLHYYIRGAEECAAQQRWPLNTESCGKYGGCPYREVCAKGPAMRQVVLDNDFVVNQWDPTLSRGDD